MKKTDVELILGYNVSAGDKGDHQAVELCEALLTAWDEIESLRAENRNHLAYDRMVQKSRRLDEQVVKLLQQAVELLGGNDGREDEAGEGSGPEN